MTIQEVGSGDTRVRPIKLGGALITLVEPHEGHQVAYNRWYERDHFYAGCMIGAWTIAGTRYVATRAEKAKRYPASSSFAPDTAKGSYLALYWILAGKFGEWMQWGTDQVNWLHDNDRMFPHRDHVHTLMYKFSKEQHATDDGVPTEMALDHRYPGLAMVVFELADGVTPDRVAEWSAARPLPADQLVTFTPVPLMQDAPKDVPRDDALARYVHLYFLEEDAVSVWDDRFAGLGAEFDAAGLGRVVFASPFRATVPGTDTYTDELW